MKETLYARKVYGEHKGLWYYLLEEEEKSLFGLAVVACRDKDCRREEAIFTEEAADALFLLETFSSALVMPEHVLELLDDRESEME